MSLRPIFEAFTSGQHRAQNRSLLGAEQFLQFMESTHQKKLLANCFLVDLQVNIFFKKIWKYILFNPI